MPYRKQDWASQTKIPKSSMIAMDDQIADNDSRITSHTARLTAVEATASEANTKATTANTTISGIVNGTTPAGNATKLNGHPASDFATSATVTALADDVSVSKAELVVLGWNVPSGMSVKNTFVDGVFTQKVGRVDLGSLSWVYDLSNGFFYSSIIVDAKIERRWDGVACYNSFYPTMYGNLSSAPAHIVGLYDMRVYIIDSAYNDASTFINHTKDQYLYYELAEYKTYTLADYPSTDIKSAELQALGWCVPDGMPIKNTLANGILTQRVQRTDMSLLEWSRSAYAGINLFYAALPLSKHNDSSVSLPCYAGGRYTSRLVGYADLKDRECGLYGYTTDYSGIFIRDDSYPDANSFAAVVNGYIYYELSTPITHNLTDLPSQKSMISDAWDDDPSNKVYYVGDLRIDGNRLYKCYVQTDKTSGRPSVDTAHWRKTSITEEISKKSDAKYTASYDVLELGILEGSTYRLFIRENSMQYYKGDTLIWSINGLHN